jgi:predicted DNA-binding transcriptional regulator AlpA
VSANIEQSCATGRRLIDVKALGERLGCSWRTALRHADEGVVPGGVRIGWLRRWDATEIDAWIAAGCVPPGPEKAPVRQPARRGGGA